MRVKGLEWGVSWVDRPGKDKVTGIPDEKGAMREPGGKM